VHNLSFTRSDGSAWCGRAQARLSRDRSALELSMRDSGVSRTAVEIWKLSDCPSPDRGGEERPTGPSGFVLVILQRLRDSEEEGTFKLAFDLSKAATMSGCIDVSDLRRLGFAVPSARQVHVENIALPLAAPDRRTETRHYPAATPRRRYRRNQGSRRNTKLDTGCFATRAEFTARIWALQRQQMFPNFAAIARECGTTPDVVRAVIGKQEGLEGYLQTGCLLG
jgi:hypothetical protein